MSNIFDLFKKIETETKPTTPPTHIIAGLGNPGKKYAFTRHNTGFLSIDYIAKKYHATMDRAKFHALMGETVISGKRTLLLMPQTLMNASGLAVREAAEFYHIPPEHILIICDDINLDLAKLRIRRKGSDGGQKGVRDIIAQMGSENIPRIKVGVGKKPNPQMNLADFVLSTYTENERKLLAARYEDIADAAALILNGEFDLAMQKYNG